MFPNSRTCWREIQIWTVSLFKSKIVNIIIPLEAHPPLKLTFHAQVKKSLLPKIFIKVGHGPILKWVYDFILFLSYPMFVQNLPIKLANEEETTSLILIKDHS